MKTTGPGRVDHRFAVAGVTGYVLLACSGVVALLLGGTDPAPVAVLAVLATSGLVVALTRLLGSRSVAARRLTVDTGVIADANPAHRLDVGGAGELAPLARAVNLLADAREEALRGAADQAVAGRRDVESERNRLAALMARLTVAVLVCNSEGRILLYNEAARTLLGEESPVGLGRSVFGLVDRGLVTHAYERLTSRSDTDYTATTLHGDRLLRVGVTLVPDPGTDTPSPAGASAGFVIVLEDLTRQVRAGDHRDRLLRHLTEETRASLGSIRAAAEAVLDFPDLTRDERQRFLEIVREEADQLGGRVKDLTEESRLPADAHILADIVGDDVLHVLAVELERRGIVVSPAAADSQVWVRTDAHAVARAVGHLASRLLEEHDVQRMTLTLTRSGQHGQVDACWEGTAPPAARVEAWLDEPLEGGGSPTARVVAERHGAEVWCADGVGGTAYLRVLLPLAADSPVGPEEPAVGGAGVRAAVASRPEYYDFDLFHTPAQSPDLADRRLDEMAFTVFDTETTGLDPVGGDRIISIGAVRVVNGRVLRRETFERLVHPGRSVPAASTAIHGITLEMLEGAPEIGAVLPTFARFAEDTVLVGHNVAFDLRFVKLAETAAGVVASAGLWQPALDTLLLHAALHPDHHEHTLEAIARRLGVSVVGRHTALGDALVTAEVLVGLLPLLRRRGVITLGQAVEAARRTYQARVSDDLYGGRG